MVIADQKIKAVIVSRDTRLLNVLLNKTSSNYDDPDIDVENDIVSLTSKSVADVYLYDLDIINDDVGSAIQAISDFKSIIAKRPLILIGKQETLNRVLSEDEIKKMVARTINKPLSYGQLRLAINACSVRPVQRMVAVKKSKQPRRLAVLGLTLTALVLIAVTYFKTDQSPFVSAEQSLSAAKPAIKASPKIVTISAAEKQVQKLNELAQTAINDNRLISPENDNALYYLKQLEGHDSYNSNAHQTRNELLSLLKISYENRTYNSNSLKALRVLSAIVEIEPYNQKYVFLLKSFNQSKSNFNNVNTNDSSQKKVEQKIKESLESIQVRTEVITKDTLENIERSSIAIVSEPVEDDSEFLIAAMPAAVEQERLIASINSASMLDMPLELSEARIESAKVLKRIEPKYPKMAVDLNHEGWIELEYQVDTQGHAVNIKTAQGERIKTFEQSAIKAIKKWKFMPSKDLASNNSVLSEPMTAKFNFSLD